MQKVLDDIKVQLAIATTQSEKLQKGVKIAGPQLRNALLMIAKLAGDGRKIALVQTKELPVKKRDAKVAAPVEQPVSVAPDGKVAEEPKKKKVAKKAADQVAPA